MYVHWAETEITSSASSPCVGLSEIQSLLISQATLQTHQRGWHDEDSFEMNNGGSERLSDLN